MWIEALKKVKASIHSLFNPVSCTLRQKTITLSHASDHIQPIFTPFSDTILLEWPTEEIPISVVIPLANKIKAQAPWFPQCRIGSKPYFAHGKVLCPLHCDPAAQQWQDEKPLLQLCRGHPPTITQRPLGMIQQLVTINTYEAKKLQLQLHIMLSKTSSVVKNYKRNSFQTANRSVQKKREKTLEATTQINLNELKNRTRHSATLHDENKSCIRQRFYNNQLFY